MLRFEKGLVALSSLFSAAIQIQSGFLSLDKDRQQSYFVLHGLLFKGKDL